MSSEASSNLFTVNSPTHFQELLSADLSRVSVLNFWASFAEPCTTMNAEVEKLSKDTSSILFLNIEAEEQPDIVESFNVTSVPTVLLLQGHTLLARIDGADVERLRAEVAKHSRKTPQALSHTDQAPAAPAAVEDTPTETGEELEKRLKGLMEMDKVVLFMKGSPDVPRCGFSRQIVGLLKEQNIQFSHFDILSDESVRSGLKVVNNWPTFPQLIVNGEFVGGLDIVKEMISSGEFSEVVTGA